MFVGANNVCVVMPHVSILCLPDIATHDKTSQVFSSVFAYCKQSKAGAGEGPENEARYSTM